MEFEAFSNKYKPIVEEQLQKYLSFRIDDNRRVLVDAMQYSLSAKAKRIRPLIAIATFLLFSKNIEKILPFCASIEMIHTYSLIHDDLPSMDNDDYRRGKLTCHKKFGEDVAILAGDTLNTLALEIICQDLPKYYDANKVIQALKLFAGACGINGMAGGQVLDILTNNSNQDFDYLVNMHKLKTGALIKAAVMVPAILENADENVLFRLNNFAYHLGLLFQIADDILDVVGVQEKIGKSLNKDQEQNKLTYVQLFGLEKAKRKVVEETEIAYTEIMALKNYDNKYLLSILDFLKTRDY
jgi:geranylgeranyl diphosphate synthase, type II